MNIGKSGEPRCICILLSFAQPFVCFFLCFILVSKCSCVFHGTPSHALVAYHLERGMMPLHDAVGVNSENGTTTENQGAGALYMG